MFLLDIFSYFQSSLTTDMHGSLLIMLTLSIVEIILLFFGAVILGITIHFTLTTRKNLKASMTDKEELNRFRDEWKSRYFNDIEAKDKDLAALREQLTQLKSQANVLQEQLNEAEENSNIYSIEADEMRKENKKLLADIAALQEKSGSLTPASSSSRPDYLEQLRAAHANLAEQNQRINELLGNIDLAREREELQREMQRSNDELAREVEELKARLSEKDREVSSIRQKDELTREMTSMLDSAYSEFNVLQSKMQKLELQVSSSRMINMEYEDLKESHRKISREYEEQKQRLTTMTAEHQLLHSQLAETQDKLHEANFQRQQLQKRVAYLEELNGDIQAVTDANKKLEGQLKRIGELESMLHVVAEERDQLRGSGGENR